ncbi:alpha/beta hydrolase [Streptomyces sp. PKU-MA01144]|uniref:alpha/beta fold hydrolase n=1 Tax=Streptomyces TaxID=1883 RepID=UPI00147F67BB|nr:MULTISPECIES: alpha/beta fold hydrolase [Streptomyces]MCY0983261.1 alpha/beta fold hydrolase [Streptomyces tirandamycinicus]NNJ06541.1 alpha/beta hydrolase [Streptomyces sp. PKU-MA01144]
MTAFVLVSGGHTGGWVWRDVAAGLRESGAVAYPVTLTGMGDRRHLGGPDTDMDTHVEDLVQIVDHADEPEVVLVGHCYGSYPVLGAASRRPERVGRIVFVDAPLPRDGLSVLQQVREQMPDGPVRDRMLGQPARAEGGWRVPAPTAEEWREWGNPAGVPEDGIARLARLAAPQPVGTLTTPVRFTGAVDELPMTGVFCADGGTMDIAGVEALVATGSPLFRQLAEPRWGFFELATGHWPMLSTPGELVEILLRAAAGEGRRLGARS